MSGDTCAYEARREAPDTWHGDDAEEWFLDEAPEDGGLGVERWDCPHPPIDLDDEADDETQTDGKYCIFHTDPGELPDDVDESEAIVEAIASVETADVEAVDESTREKNGDGATRGGSEHRAQFVGATFGDVEISGETIAAAAGRDVRFDHAVFGEVRFDHVTFETRGGASISFAGARFEPGGDGDAWFRRATFEAGGGGDVTFTGATFAVGDGGHAWLPGATFAVEDGGDVAFDGTTFVVGDEGYVSFDAATFETGTDGQVTFSDATFETGEDGAVRFGGTTFETGDGGHVWFRDATFETGDGGTTLFDEATFESDGDGGVWFDKATFDPGEEATTQFEETTFLDGGGDGVGFRRATFGGEVSFEEATFGGRALFEYRAIERGTRLSFSEATFVDDLVFGPRDDVPSVRGELDFSDATFHGGIEFQGAPPDEATSRAFDVVFVDDVDFGGISFPDGVDFSRTWFPPGATFDRADLSGANFTGADLASASIERAQLNRAELLGANLIGARLYGTLLGDARIDRETTFWPTADATTGILWNPGEPSLRESRLRRVKTLLRGGTLPYCVYDYRYPVSGDPNGGVEERPNADGANDEGRRDLERAAEVYGTLESLARENSLPRLASECFLGRKDVQLRQYRRDRERLMTIRSLVPNAVARYGESPWRVLGTGAATILLWGLAYWAFDLLERAGDSDAPVMLFDSFYFSALTFTTLGYGDFNPTGPAGQVLAVAETSIGVILLAILVFVFGRRATR